MIVNILFVRLGGNMYRQQNRLLLNKFNSVICQLSRNGMEWNSREGEQLWLLGWPYIAESFMK
jgi:hypothetical protein